MSHLSVNTWNEMLLNFNGLWPFGPLAFTSLMLIWQCRCIRILQWHLRPTHVGLLCCKYLTTIHLFCTCSPIPSLNNVFWLIIAYFSPPFLCLLKGCYEDFCDWWTKTQVCLLFILPWNRKKLSQQLGSVKCPNDVPSNWKMGAYFQYLITPLPTKFIWNF